MDDGLAASKKWRSYTDSFKHEEIVKLQEALKSIAPRLILKLLLRALGEAGQPALRASS